MPIDDLDTRIRSLVSDAVAAAPPPPELDVAVAGRTAPVVSLSAARSRRWLATLTAAAAIMGVVLVANRDTDTLPGTDVTVPAAPVNAVTAGSDGVWVVGSDGSRTQWWNQPASFAMQAPDGSLIVQRHRGIGDAESRPGEGWKPADTLPFRLASPNAYPVALLSEKLGPGWYSLQDVARLLDGRAVALVTRQTLDKIGDFAYVTSVLTVDLQTGEDDIVAASRPLDFSSRVHLAENGIIVAEILRGPTTSLWSAAVPGDGPLATRGIESEAAGLALQYVNPCTDCPRFFAIDRTGAVLGWLEGADLVLRSLATETQRRVPLGDRATNATDIDIDLVIGGDLGGPLVVAIEYGGDVPSSVVLDVGDNGITERAISSADTHVNL